MALRLNTTWLTGEGERPSGELSPSSRCKRRRRPAVAPPKPRPKLTLAGRAGEVASLELSSLTLVCACAMQRGEGHTVAWIEEEDRGAGDTRRLKSNPLSFQLMNILHVIRTNKHTRPLMIRLIPVIPAPSTNPPPIKVDL